LQRKSRPNYFRYKLTVANEIRLLNVTIFNYADAFILHFILCFYCSLIYSLYRSAKLWQEQKKLKQFRDLLDESTALNEKLLNFIESYGLQLAPKSNFNFVRKLIKRKSNRHLRVFIISFEISLFLGAVQLAMPPAELSANMPGKKSEQLVKGVIAYEVPEWMDLGEYYDATVWITRRLIDSIIDNDLKRRGVIVKKMKNSSKLSVSLVDPTNVNFQINSLSTFQKTIHYNLKTEWKWKVKPIRGGRNELVLRITIKIPEEQDLFYTIPITVKATFSAIVIQFISDYWQLLCTGVIFPFIILLLQKLFD
jgi:hypothetical protein